MRLHREKNAASTIALSRGRRPLAVRHRRSQNEDGRIKRFLEKPKGGDVFSNTANTGVYLFEPEVFDMIPPDTFWGFGNNVFPQLLAENKPLYGYLTNAYWMDVGNLKIYRQTNFDALSGRVVLDFPLAQTEAGHWQGDGVQIDPSAQIVSPVVIGTGVTIGAGAKIGENTIIGDGCMIEPNVTLRETILWAGARVSQGTHLERCVVGTNAQVQSNVAIFDANIIDPTRRMTAKT